MTATLIEKLRDMIDAVKEHDISIVFRDIRDWLERIDTMETVRVCWDFTTSETHSFYSQISFLFNEGEGLPAGCHSFILTYYLLVFISSASGLLNGRYVSF